MGLKIKRRLKTAYTCEWQVFCLEKICAPFLRLKGKIFPFVTSGPGIEEKFFHFKGKYIHLIENFFHSWFLILKNSVKNRAIERQIKEKSWHEISN